MWEHVFNVCCGVELCYWQLTGTIYVMIYMNSKRMVKHFGEQKTQQATSLLGLGMKLQRFDIKPVMEADTNTKYTPFQSYHWLHYLGSDGCCLVCSAD